MLVNDKAVKPTLVTDEGTRSFVSLSQYLQAPILPDDDPFQMHEWFPLFVSYQRELKVKSELDDNGFETFIPMEAKVCRKDGKIVRCVEPAIHNLIFIKSYYERIRWMKMYNKVCTSMQFTSKGSQTPQDTIIPLVQMTRFIEASRKAEDNEHALYLSPTEIEQFKGREVKFVKGIFEGIEGYIQRINKNKMVVVTLKDLISIALPVSRKDELAFIK
ncbi:MAG: UpxY family transcription antiterminator [Prevotella sp.]|nr:UpxY family transcription antiterminator [Prevotella sp.]